MCGWTRATLIDFGGAITVTPPRLTSRYARCFADPPPPGEGEASALAGPTIRPPPRGVTRERALRAAAERQHPVHHLASLAEVIGRVAQLLQLGFAHVLGD